MRTRRRGAAMSAAVRHWDVKAIWRDRGQEGWSCARPYPRRRLMVRSWRAQRRVERPAEQARRDCPSCRRRGGGRRGAEAIDFAWEKYKGLGVPQPLNPDKVTGKSQRRNRRRRVSGTSCGSAIPDAYSLAGWTLPVLLLCGRSQRAQAHPCPAGFVHGKILVGTEALCLESRVLCSRGAPNRSYHRGP